MRTLLIAMVGLVVAGAGVARAVTCEGGDCVINNGLAPPNPENVISDGTYSTVNVFVRSVGCPPGWPSGDADAPCPSPGTPTGVALTDGGGVVVLTAYDSSTVTMSGGFVWGLGAYDFSTITMTGGTVDLSGVFGVFSTDSSTITISGGELDSLQAYSSSTITMTGGTIDFDLQAFNSSTVTIVGRNFEVDGVPVPYGDLSALTGTLKGRLVSGDPINNVFYQGGGSYTGTITLVPPDYLPTLSPWSQLALIAGLLGAGLGVWRGRRG